MKRAFGTRGTGIGTGTRISSGPRDWNRDRRFWDAWDWDMIRWDVPGLTLSGTRVPGTQILWDSWDVPCPSLLLTMFLMFSVFPVVSANAIAVN